MIDFDPYAFWMNPDASTMPNNVKSITRPSFYLDKPELTNCVCETMLKYVPFHESIMELGSGTGRNLAGLKRIGYSDLWGVEINHQAVEMGREKWPMLNKVPIWCGQIEDAIKFAPPMDCIFTLGTLMHLPPASEWVFEAMSKKARKVIITIELEDNVIETRPLTVGGGVFAWVRNYSQIFSGLGWDEQEFRTCEGLGPLLGKDNVMRVFGHG